MTPHKVTINTLDTGESKNQKGTLFLSLCRTHNIIILVVVFIIRRIVVRVIILERVQVFHIILDFLLLLELLCRW